jgi:hypothetical protein
MTNGSQRGLGLSSYIGSQVYQNICNRFYNRHQIKFPDHIASVLKVGVLNGQGIEFVAKDAARFGNLLRMPRFAPDDRRHLCDRVASLATKGQGYREVGVPSLHVAVSPDLCSVHIDTFGFVAIGPNGQKYYNPDAIQHILDELVLQDKFVGWVTKHNRSLGAFLGRVHFVGPSSRNRYRLAAGGRFNLKQGVGWSIGIEANKSLSGEKRYMGKVDVFGW